jgi:hypothetical protein
MLLGHYLHEDIIANLHLQREILIKSNYACEEFTSYLKKVAMYYKYRSTSLSASGCYMIEKINRVYGRKKGTTIGQMQGIYIAQNTTREVTPTDPTIQNRHVAYGRLRTTVTEGLPLAARAALVGHRHFRCW